MNPLRKVFDILETLQDGMKYFDKRKKLLFGI
jgi:hypothetical protein